MLKNLVFDWGKGVVLLRVVAGKMGYFSAVTFFTTYTHVENNAGLFTGFYKFFLVVSHTINQYFTGVRVGFLHIINNTYKDNNEYKYLIT